MYNYYDDYYYYHCWKWYCQVLALVLLPLITYTHTGTNSNTGTDNGTGTNANKKWTSTHALVLLRKKNLHKWICFFFLQTVAWEHPGPPGTPFGPPKRPMPFQQMQKKTQQNTKIKNDSNLI